MLINRLDKRRHCHESAKIYKIFDDQKHFDFDTILLPSDKRQKMIKNKKFASSLVMSFQRRKQYGKYKYCKAFSRITRNENKHNFSITSQITLHYNNLHYSRQFYSNVSYRFDFWNIPKKYLKLNFIIGTKTPSKSPNFVGNVAKFVDKIDTFTDSLHTLSNHECL